LQNQRDACFLRRDVDENIFVHGPCRTYCSG
jgi:hypothetical protein